MVNSSPGQDSVDERLAGYLRTRRTIPAAQMGPPSPGSETLRAMLKIAARVPDHGKLAPWRFIIYEPESRAAMLDGLVRIAANIADEKERRYRAEKARAIAEAPVIVGVISAPIADHPKIPLWEQQLSAGAVCLNLLHAAAAHGFAAQWLTGWFAYDEAARRWLGLKEGERVAGFVHIGTATVPPSERERPDVDALTVTWAPP
jgi:nitroreductase